MAPNHPLRVRSQSPAQRRLLSIFAGLVLASATARLLPALTLHGQAGPHGHAATRTAAGSHGVQLQPSRILQKIAEDKRRLAFEENRLDALLHPSNATRGNVESLDSPELLAVRELRAQLTEKRRHLADLQENYTDLYPDVITTHEEITELQSKLEQAQAAVHSRPAPVVSSQTTGARDQELAEIRAAIEQKTRELARDEEAATRSDKAQPVRSGATVLSRRPAAQAVEQDTMPAGVPAAVPELPSTPVAVAKTTPPVRPAAAKGKSTVSRIAVPLLIALGVLGVAGGLAVRLQAKGKTKAGILQDSAQLRALFPDIVLIGSIPKMKPQ